MKARSLILTLILLGIPLAFAQTTLKVFVGGLTAPSVQQLLDKFNAANPGITAKIEAGGATSEAQQQYLSTVLTSKSSDLDVLMIDVIRPATYAAAKWAEPLNQYFDSDAAMNDYLSAFLPGPVNADKIDGKLYAIPAFTDAQFLYYRKDLLDKYGLQPPKTWSELKADALEITQGENDPNLQGFNYQGAAIEGTVCTFLEALWTAGGKWQDAQGNITVDSPAGHQALNWYQDTLDSGITKKSIAEEVTDGSRKEFQAGNVIFELNWGYAWAHFQNDEDSQVKGKVGVAPLPAFAGHDSATCVGGWQWAINPYSKHKADAFKLIKFLASEDSERTLVVAASQMPARKALYQDPAVLKVAPQYGKFYDVITAARPRPVTPYYDEVSNVIRTTMNAFLAQALTVDQALAQMQSGLEKIFSNQ